MKKNKFPQGWNKKKVDKVLAHYEKQSEEESLVEDEAAYENSYERKIRLDLSC